MRKILTVIALLSTAVLFAQNDESSAFFTGEYHTKGAIYKRYHFVVNSPKFAAEVVAIPKRNKVTFQFLYTALPQKGGATTGGIPEKFFEVISHSLLSDMYDRKPEDIHAVVKKKYFKTKGVSYLKEIDLQNISAKCSTKMKCS